MSTLKADAVTTKSDNTDLTITGGGTGVPNLESGFKVGGTVEKLTGVAPGTSGNLLTSDGTNWTSAAAAGGGGYQSMQIFTSSGTWTRPSGIKTVVVVVNGAGGGGAGLGGGGGGGTFAMKTIDVSSTTSVTVTIQSGGAGAAYGSSGSSSSGNTSFGSAPSVGGGSGGSASGYMAGGAGRAAGTTGHLNVAGQGGVRKRVV